MMNNMLGILMFVVLGVRPATRIIQLPVASIEAHKFKDGKLGFIVNFVFDAKTFSGKVVPKQGELVVRVKDPKIWKPVDMDCYVNNKEVTIFFLIDKQPPGRAIWHLEDLTNNKHTFHLYVKFLGKDKPPDLKKSEISIVVKARGRK